MQPGMRSMPYSVRNENMTATIATPKKVTINRWLPYWAVLQQDVHQTLRSWVYRFWVLVSSLALIGYLVYRVGIYKEAGIQQSASQMISDLFHWIVYGSVALIVVLCVGSISAERGTMADSVLSRGISRYQYFLGKWHSRLFTIVGTYFVIGTAALVSCLVMLHEDLTVSGSVMALLTVGAVLTVIVTCGVTVSGMVNSTVLGVAILWVLVYGGGLALSLLPPQFPSPDRAMESLPNILQGNFQLATLGHLIGWSAAASVVIALFGLHHFARRDV
jgi:ABC-type transport system involved in multi-copper enzyme maturation permease subunit